MEIENPFYSVIRKRRIIMSGGNYNYIYNQLFPMYGGYVYMTDIKEIAEKLKEKTDDK